MYPKHTRNVNQENEAVAPYNFVELPEKITGAELEENGSLRSRKLYHVDRQTGKIECTLTTSSPLYIRCGLTHKEFASQEAKDLPDFFYTDPSNKAPVLPGSSLRGMLRSLIEIVGYGKFDRVSDRPLVYRAVGDRTSIGDKYRDRLLKELSRREYSFQMRAGYIQKTNCGGWQILPAREISSGESFARIEQTDIPKDLLPYHNSENAWYVFAQASPVQSYPHNGGNVRLRYSKVSSASRAESKEAATGVIVKTGHMHNKHMEFVFGLPDDTTRPFIIPDEMLMEYQEQITKEQEILLGKDAAIKDKQPVFYLIEDNKLVFFGHAMMFRLPFRNSIGAFIPEALRDQNTIDLVEAIFGFTCNNKTHNSVQSAASRVFVSDGRCNHSEDLWLLDNSSSSLTPKILSSPKPTTFQHYLVQDEDSKASRYTLKHYESQPVEETVLRGHKLYWHKGSSPNIKAKKKIGEKSKQETSIKPIKPGVVFTFLIHFENLSSVELGALLWVLDIAQNEKYRLSLGMGKPLGMGAVKIEHRTHTNNRRNRYKKLFSSDRWEASYSALENERKHIDAFEDYILGEKAGQKSLVDMRRIRMLLAMLEWEGAPPSESTRYMEIERDIQKDYIGRNRGGRANEYGERPILPTPLQVLGREETASYRSSDKLTKHAEVEAPKTEKQNERLEAITSIITNQSVKEGDLLEAEVLKKGSGKKVIYKVGMVSFNEKESKNYNAIPEGEVVKVRVTSLIDGIIKHIKFVKPT